MRPTKNSPLIYDGRPGDLIPVRDGWHQFEQQQQQFGGQKPNIPKQEPVKMPEAPQMPMPQPLAAPEPIAPAPTTSKNEVQQAQEDQRQQAARRKGIRKSIIAGQTGGYLGDPAANDPSKKAILG